MRARSTIKLLVRPHARTVHTWNDNLMYTPPNENLILAVHRLRSTFANALGATKSTMGTGFWVETIEGPTFVTNRHNVDASLRTTWLAGFHLSALEIELRFFGGDAATSATKFFAVSSLQCLYSSHSADCSVLALPKLNDHDPVAFPISSVTKVKDIATAAEFESSIKVMEPAIFMGFPGSEGQHWWDEDWKLPIARECTLASWPAIPFGNSQIPTTDVLLVSGLSFSGSSGSPVFVMNRGLRPGGAVSDPTWRPARLIGIMSGHFEETTQVPSMFRHSGLSYLTRSTAIIEVMRTANLYERALDTAKS
jgi:hypothetical protein